MQHGSTQHRADAGVSFLEQRGLTVSAIADAVRAMLGFGDDDVVFIAGSLVEGLGNDASDLDVHVVTADPAVIARGGAPKRLLGVGSSCVDVEVHERAQFDAVVARAAAAARAPVETVLSLSENDRLHAHRLVVGIPIGAPAAFEALRARLSHDDLLRVKADFAIGRIGGFQIDAAGLRTAGDWASMLPLGNEILGFALDALTAAHGYTNPTTKWRIALLRRLPADWDAPIPGRRTGRTAPRAALELLRTPAVLDARGIDERTLRIIAFARRIVPWVQARMLGVPAAFASLDAAPQQQGDAAQQRDAAPQRDAAQQPEARTQHANADPLPHLLPSVRIAYRDGALRMFDMVNGGYDVTVSPGFASLAALFDGETTEDDVPAGWPHDGATRLATVRSLVRYANFAAAPVVDENRIARLLGMPVPDDETAR